MPPPSKYVLSRLKNLAKGAKRLVEHLSPRKPRKKARIEPEEELTEQRQRELSTGPTEQPSSSSFYSDVFFCGPQSSPQRAPNAMSFSFRLPEIDIPLDADGNPEIGETHSALSVQSDKSDDLNDDCSLDGEPRDGHLRQTPTVVAAKSALDDIREYLRGPSRGKGGGYKPPDLDPFMRQRMEGMKTMLALYTLPNSVTFQKWGQSSFQASLALGHGQYCARQLRVLSRAYISDRTVLPVNPYGDWNQSMLMDEELCLDINLYMQELGSLITAEKLVQFLARPDVKARHGITKSISIETARRYLQQLGFRFTYAKKGQYSDGHEREDVVKYRDTIFTPRFRQMEKRMRNWHPQNLLEPIAEEPEKPLVVWFHDETIFYANDRRRRAWYHKDAPARPYSKGDGASFMVADYISADYGFLESIDKQQNARRIFRPGKNKDGYFSNDDVLEQFRAAVAIVREAYPNDEHIFIYDNAKTHTKRPENSPSARNMPKFTPKPGTNWLIDVTKCDENGKALRHPDGSVQKHKVRMTDGFFDGKPQSFYFPEGHERAGVFKGMAVILEERGIDTAQKKAQCKDFKCPPGSKDCCCRRILFNQPDFTSVESILEHVAKDLGVTVIFLPKFHCELNPIEQCWGYAKLIYRLNPESTREDQLEKNALNSLSGIPLATIRKFCYRSRRFIDAYHKGLNGSQAAWAARKYRGHRVLPESLLADMERASVI